MGHSPWPWTWKMERDSYGDMGPRELVDANGAEVLGPWGEYAADRFEACVALLDELKKAGV